MEQMGAHGAPCNLELVHAPRIADAEVRLHQRQVLGNVAPPGSGEMREGDHNHSQPHRRLTRRTARLSENLGNMKKICSSVSSGRSSMTLQASVARAGVSETASVHVSINKGSPVLGPRVSSSRGQRPKKEDWQKKKRAQRYARTARHKQGARHCTRKCRRPASSREPRGHCAPAQHSHTGDERRKKVTGAHAGLSTLRCIPVDSSRSLRAKCGGLPEWEWVVTRFFLAKGLSACSTMICGGAREQAP